MNEETKNSKTTMDLKPLREARKANIDRAREAVKEQNRVIKAIREALADGGKTIPNLTQAVGMETETVFFYVSTLKKYGIVGEGRKDGSYFTYELIK